MGILVGADLVPTNTNEHLFCEGNTTALLGRELAELVQKADYRIFNLESPLTDKKDPIVKWGPHLGVPTNTVNGYVAMGVDLLTLANNHILDQGAQGLQSTCEALNKAGISYFGVGDNVEQAAKPFFFECNNKKIGVYACVEHEFSLVIDHSPGANPFDELDAPDHVAKLKENCDFAIVLYHGGKEHYRYPSPRLQKVCRKLVDKGADLVICQHSHCIGCEEKYENGTIIYGQGNFLFDHSESEFWQTALLVEIGKNFEITYIPVRKNGHTVKLAEGDEAKKILDEFYGRSEEIKLPGVVEQKYEEFATTMIKGYLLAFSGERGFLAKVLNKLTKGRLYKRMMKKKYGKRNKLAVRNYIECEAHRELFLCGLKTQK